MKKLLFTLPSIILMGLVSCNNSTDAHQADASEAVTVDSNAVQGDAYQVNINESTVHWVGSKLVGSGHNGTIKIKSGAINVNTDNQISGGEFVIDMLSIANDDITVAEDKAKLEGHLKSADFFEVEKYPEAKFIITSVTPATDADKQHFKDATHLVSGNFTMKDQTHNINIPANISVLNNTLTATSEFNIDRTQWNVNYQSDASIKDKFINKEINLKLNLKATK